MKHLPPNWITVTINDIAEYISRGKSPKYTEHSILPVINQKAIRWFGIEDRYLKYIHPDQIKEWTEERFIRDGDILWNSTGRGTMGRACLVHREHLIPPKVVDSHVTIVRPFKDAIDSRYLFAWIRSPHIQDTLESLATGATNQIELSRASIAKIELPLAPLNEQIRIAEKLDSLFARIESCESHLQRVPQILKHFRQSILAKAISGELTEDWRGSETTENWSFERAKDVCEKVQSGGTPREGFIVKPGVPFLKVYNIVDQKIDFHYRPQYITKQIHAGSMSKSQAKPGDVLMNIVGPPLGKVAIVPDDFSQWNINQAITLFRPNERIISKWIYYFLCSGYSVSEIIHKTRGSAGQINISLSQCRDFVFPIPPIEEQNEIVRRVEKLFAYAERLETHYQSAAKRVEQLLPSLLVKAFRGELVEQDLNDESAFVILERSKMQKLAKPNRPKRIPKTVEFEERTKMTEDTVKEIIMSLKKKKFSFDELREKSLGDYEGLKDILFKLLEEPNPIISQVFDESAKAIRFVRRSI